MFSSCRIYWKWFFILNCSTSWFRPKIYTFLFCNSSSRSVSDYIYSAVESMSAFIPLSSRSNEERLLLKISCYCCKSVYFLSMSLFSSYKMANLELIYLICSYFINNWDSSSLFYLSSCLILWIFFVKLISSTRFSKQSIFFSLSSSFLLSLIFSVMTSSIFPTRF